MKEKKDPRHTGAGGQGPQGHGQKATKTHRGETVHLDGGTFEDEEFYSCELVYSGGGLPSIVRCDFHDCRWTFADQAERTLIFMSQLYQGGMKPVVEHAIAALGRGDNLQRK